MWTKRSSYKNINSAIRFKIPSKFESEDYPWFNYSLEMNIIKIYFSI